MEMAYHLALCEEILNASDRNYVYRILDSRPQTPHSSIHNFLQLIMVLSSSALTHQSMGLSPSAVTTRSRSQFHHHTHNSGTVLTRAMHSMHADGDRNDVNSSRRQALLALSSSMLVLPGLVGSGLAEEPVKSAYDFDLQYRGDPFPLNQYKNKVTVFVNVASE